MCLTALSPAYQAVAQTAGKARATQAPSPESTAKALFREGLEHSRAGRAGEAVLAFERSRALSERPSVLQNLAFALERVGRYADALEVIERFFVLTQGHTRSTASDKLASLREQLKQRVLVLRLAVEPTDAELQVDGMSQQRSNASDDADARNGAYLLVLDPGKHVMRATRPGYVDRSWQLVAAPGASLTDRVTLTPVASSIAAPTLTEPPAELQAKSQPAQVESRSSHAAWAYTLGGAALVLTGAGAATYVRAGQKVDDCPDAVCTRAQGDVIERLDYTSIALFVAAGAAAVGGAVLWYQLRRKQARPVQLGVQASGRLLLRLGF